MTPERDLAASVVAYLVAEGWTVYQEVVTGRGIADIVATAGRHCWIVECKVSLGFDVIAQAAKQRSVASFVSVAVPRAKTRSEGRSLAYKTCAWQGIGVLEVDGDDCSVMARPSLCRIGARARLVDRLCEEQKTHAHAGTNRGGYWTPYKGTCRDVLEYVRSHPGATVKQVIAGIPQHHWSSDASARSCLIANTERGIVPGVELRREGRSITLWPSEKSS